MAKSKKAKAAKFAAMRKKGVPKAAAKRISGHKKP